MDTRLSERSCSTKKLERDDDSKKSHPALQRQLPRGSFTRRANTVGKWVKRFKEAAVEGLRDRPAAATEALRRQRHTGQRIAPSRPQRPGRSRGSDGGRGPAHGR